MLSQGYRTGQIQGFWLLLSNSVEHFLFQSGIINTKFYAVNGSRDRSIWLFPREPSPSGNGLVCSFLFVEEKHLYAALACFFGLVAVNDLILLYRWWVGELCSVGGIFGECDREWL